MLIVYAATVTVEFTALALVARALSVCVLLMVNGPVYADPPGPHVPGVGAVGVVLTPTHIVAPAVASVMVISCAEVYVPATGLNTGVATVGVMVYRAVATALLVKLPNAANAFTVVVTLIDNGVV